jgi:DNA-binding response OmpR family regulator
MSGTEPPAARSRATLLVVDDEAPTREILRGLLEDDGFDVLLAADGRDALRKVTFGVSLVLLDLLMPGVDGLTTCQELKSRPETARVPVLFLSGCDGEGLSGAARQAGAYDYLLKPVRLGELRVKVSAVLRIDPSQHAEERQKLYARFVEEGTRAAEHEEAGADRRMDDAGLPDE